MNGAHKRTTDPHGAEPEEQGKAKSYNVGHRNADNGKSDGVGERFKQMFSGEKIRRDNAEPDPGHLAPRIDGCDFKIGHAKAGERDENEQQTSSNQR